MTLSEKIVKNRNKLRYSSNPQDEALTELGRQEMEQAAYKLPVPSATQGPHVKIHILTGDKHWYQAAFCLWTFSATSGRVVAPFIFDDGSLKLEQIEALKRLFPRLKFMGASETLDRLDEFLPERRYPSLRAQQKINPMYKKILDIHAGEKEWRLQMDCDILFFHAPEALLKWHDSPDLSLYLRDIKDSYSCSIETLNSLARQPIISKFNAGLVGVRSIDVEWGKMEFWSKKIIAEGGPSHLHEQTLWALHFTEHDCVALDHKDYMLLPNPTECHECRAVMHHYVAQSRKWYFQKNWRRFIAGNQQ